MTGAGWRRRSLARGASLGAAVVVVLAIAAAVGLSGPRPGDGAGHEAQPSRRDASNMVGETAIDPIAAVPERASARDPRHRSGQQR